MLKRLAQNWKSIHDIRATSQKNILQHMYACIIVYTLQNTSRSCIGFKKWVCCNNRAIDTIVVFWRISFVGKHCTSNSHEKCLFCWLCHRTTLKAVLNILSVMGWQWKWIRGVWSPGDLTKWGSFFFTVCWCTAVSPPGASLTPDWGGLLHVDYLPAPPLGCLLSLLTPNFKTLLDKVVEEVDAYWRQR